MKKSHNYIIRDNFYIDFYNSVFCKEEVDENGDLVSNKSEAFSEINELDSIKNISFSFKRNNTNM